MSTPPPLRTIAVVGAGMSGLRAAARIQTESNASVHLFDKARGVGGRTSLRRADSYAFDHGAQYFTARDAAFRRQVDHWVDGGIAAPYEGRIAGIPRAGTLDFKESDTTERFVGVPGMNAMAKAMAKGLDVSVRSRVTSVQSNGSSWTLAFEDGHSEKGFDAVLVTAPAPQAADLVADASEELRSLCERAPMTPCWAVMVAFGQRFEAPFDGAFIDEGPLTWACRNSAKPGRPPGDAWVLHASPEWTEAHLDQIPEYIAAQLTEALGRAAGVEAPPIIHVSTHRWMYSGAKDPLTDVAVFDRSTGLGLGGDWLNGSKVQGAWLSGDALGSQVVDWLEMR